MLTMPEMHAGRSYRDLFGPCTRAGDARCAGATIPSGGFDPGGEDAPKAARFPQTRRSAPRS